MQHLNKDQKRSFAKRLEVKPVLEFKELFSREKRYIVRMPASGKVL
jgi:hypothetical protein